MDSANANNNDTAIAHAKVCLNCGTLIQLSIPDGNGGQICAILNSNIRAATHKMEPVALACLKEAARLQERESLRRKSRRLRRSERKTAKERSVEKQKERDDGDDNDVGGGKVNFVQ